MKFYQAGLDFKPKNISQDGSEIPVDPMGYWNPENVGNPVIIPSNKITMEGVDQPLIGISDTGDVQYMMPGEDYEFDGESVTEYPVMQKGGSVPTTADSLEVYNNAVAIRNYYDNLQKKGWYDKPKVEDLSSYLNKDFSKEMMDRVKQESLETYRNILSKKDGKGDNHFTYFKNVYPNASYDDYLKSVSKSLVQTKSGTGDKYYYKDLYPSVIDPMAPSTLVNLKILPNEKITFTQKGDRNKIEKTPPGGYVTGLYSYNPLSVKPYNMRTPKEREEWNKKYGDPNQAIVSAPKPKPTQKTTKPQPKVETKKPEPKKEEPVKKEELKPIERKQNIYEGSPVYSPGAGTGMGSALIGFLGQQGDTTYIKPEDYERFAVPKYGKAFIESKVKKQRNGGVNNADAQPIKKLDQLLNFTNYNKPTKGGWLDKYN
jgi:hypothetical protein